MGSSIGHYGHACHVFTDAETETSVLGVSLMPHFSGGHSCLNESGTYGMRGAHGESIFF